MRVLHVISSLVSGGAQSMLAKLVEALPAPDHEHVVVSLVSGGLFADRLVRQKVRVIGLGQRRSLGAAWKLRELKSIVRETSPTVIQGWMYHGNLAASAAASGRPVVWNIRQRLERLSNNRMLTRAVIVGSLLHRRSVSAAIYNSVKAAEEHEAWGYPRDKRLLIPNGFDTSAFVPDPTASAWLRTELGLAADTPIVGRVARDNIMKDTPTLLDAFAAMETKATHLALVGRGMDDRNAEVSRLILQRALQWRVHLMGERDDIARLNAGFDVAVLSSSHGEGFPNVVCEAMAAGTPVVTTDTGECRDIIGDDARVVRSRDGPALAAALDRVLAMPQPARAQLGLQDRQRVTNAYSLPSIAARYADAWSRAA